MNNVGGILITQIPTTGTSSSKPFPQPARSLDFAGRSGQDVLAPKH
jgi:hypothetical protein